MHKNIEGTKIYYITFFNNLQCISLYNKLNVNNHITFLIFIIKYCNYEYNYRLLIFLNLHNWPNKMFGVYFISFYYSKCKKPFFNLVSIEKYSYFFTSITPVRTKISLFSLSSFSNLFSSSFYFY